MFSTFITANGGTTRRVQLWKTKVAKATAADVTAYELTLNKEYTCWIATRDGVTQSGNPVAKGEYFFIEN